MSSVTIRDVARAAGVGVATVSRVLNGSPQVKPHTRERVQEVIAELGYTPNVAARQLSGGKTHVISVLTPFISVPSFMERMSGIQQVLLDTEYDLVLHTIESPSQVADTLDKLINQNRVDGAILLTPPNLDESWLQNHRDVPIVVMDSESFIDYYPTVTIDDVRGGELATQYLVDHGHKHIGFIGDELQSPYGFTRTEYRFQGYKSVLAANNLPLRSDWCEFGDMDQGIARRQARSLLNREDRPTAIFVSSDMKAFAAIHVAHEIGLRVPEDVAIIGFDNIQMAYYMNLTTVDQHLYEGGETAARLLVDRLSSETVAAPQVELQKLKIIERGTV